MEAWWQALEVRVRCRWPDDGNECVKQAPVGVPSSLSSLEAASVLVQHSERCWVVPSSSQNSCGGPLEEEVPRYVVQDDVQLTMLEHSVVVSSCWHVQLAPACVDADALLLKQLLALGHAVMVKLEGKLEVGLGCAPVHKPLAQHMWRELLIDGCADDALCLLASSRAVGPNGLLRQVCQGDADRW